MKKLIILGGRTNETMMVNHLVKEMECDDELQNFLLIILKSTITSLVFYLFLLEYIQMEKYRFFESIKSMMAFPVKFNETFSPEDIHNMEKGTKSLLKLFNRFAKPETVEKLDEIGTALENADIKKDYKVSIFKVIKKFKS